MLKFAKSLGARGVKMTCTGRHPKLEVTRPDGSQFRMCVSATPSCHRSGLNEKARLRRRFAATRELEQP
jgi:hypothetical protein